MNGKNTKNEWEKSCWEGKVMFVNLKKKERKRYVWENDHTGGINLCLCGVISVK